MEEEIRELLDALEEASVDLLAKYAEPWQGDNPDDILARGMIGALRPLMTALTNAVRGEDPPTRLMMALAVKEYEGISRHVKALEQLATLRDQK